jgi:hypothetical protein
MRTKKDLSTNFLEASVKGALLDFEARNIGLQLGNIAWATGYPIVRFIFSL